jgi:3-hydroxyisobutyrate dehydrogenase-like beta-hydroxyacid dehydrogenase
MKSRNAGLIDLLQPSLDLAAVRGDARHMKITVFGMGIIGSRCAEQLASAGHDVTRWNRTPKGLAHEVSDAGEAAAASPVLSFYLKDAPAVRAVAEHIKPALTPDHIVLNHSTIDLDTTLWLAETCRKSGCRFVDAPFTGSKLAAADGKLLYYLAGDDASVDEAVVILEPTASGLLRMGKTGNATVIKLATNLIAACHIQALAEAQALCSHHGLDSAAIADALSKHGTASVLSAMKVPAMLAGDFDTHFSLDNMRKDSAYALELGAQHHLSLPAIDAVSRRMTELCGDGFAEMDYCVLARAYRKS